MLWYEGNGRPSFLHALCLSVTESGCLRDLIVRFLTRPGCHLCDDARPLVLAEAKRADVKIEELNIETDDQLVSMYGLRIPVLLAPNETVLIEGIINDPKTLRKRVKRL